MASRLDSYGQRIDATTKFTIQIRIDMTDEPTTSRLT